MNEWWKEVADSDECEWTAAWWLEAEQDPFYVVETKDGGFFVTKYLSYLGFGELLTARLPSLEAAKVAYKMLIGSDYDD